MNKFASIAWLLLLSPILHIDQSQLTISCEEPFEGVLYLDDEVFLEIEKDDFIENQLCIEDVRGGIYTLFDDEGQMVERVVLKDEKTHIAFNEIIQAKVDHQYLFQKKPKVLIVSEVEDERYEGEFKKDYYYYEFETETITFLEETYELYVDDKAPIISLDAYYLESEDVYYTNTKELILHYEDECPDPFVLYPEKEIHITLQEGINDLSSYLKDQANLSSTNQLWVILDQTAPCMDVERLMYISKAKTFEINEPYLNLEKSKLIINGKDVPFTKSTFEITETSNVELVLEDYAGNIQTYTFDVIYDDISPVFYKELTGNQLHISYSEPLKYSNVKIKGTDELLIKDYTFNQEGIYILEGEMIDYAGNITDVYETIRVDFYHPELSILEASQTYLEVPTIHVSGSDTFNLEWQIEVYRNDELYTTFQGTGDFNQEILLDEDAFKEANGAYEIKAYASDGIYENTLVESYIVDLYCAPLEVRIDGYEASLVRELLVNRLIELDMNCSEARPIYRLYLDDKLLKEGQGSTLLLSPDDGYTHLEVIVKDEFGHENKQTIQLTYPSLPVIYFEGEVDEVIEEVSIEEVINEDVYEEENETMIEEVSEEESEKSYIGGWLIGALIVSVFVFGKIRFKKNRHDSDCEKTVLFENQEDTILLDHPKARDK